MGCAAFGGAMARSSRAVGLPGSSVAASSSAVTSMLASVVNGKGEKSAVCGFGALAMDSLMLVGSPGTRWGYGDPRGGARLAPAAPAPAALADAEPFVPWCGGAGRSASAGSISGSPAGEPAFGVAREEAGADMIDEAVARERVDERML